MDGAVEVLKEDLGPRHAVEPATPSFIGQNRQEPKPQSQKRDDEPPDPPEPLAEGQPPSVPLRSCRPKNRIPGVWQARVQKVSR